jgi:hypothetical protein
LTDVAREVADGQPLARGRTRPTPTLTDQGDGEAGPAQSDA